MKQYLWILLKTCRVEILLWSWVCVPNLLSCNPERSVPSFHQHLTLVNHCLYYILCHIHRTLRCCPARWSDSANWWGHLSPAPRPQSMTPGTEVSSHFLEQLQHPPHHRHHPRRESHLQSPQLQLTELERNKWIAKLLCNQWYVALSSPSIHLYEKTVTFRPLQSPTHLATRQTYAWVKESKGIIFFAYIGWFQEWC